MTKIVAATHNFDTNVTVSPPDVEVKPTSSGSWIIKMNGVTLTYYSYGVCVDKTFYDVGEALEWLTSRDLIATKAYTKYEKAINKAIKKAS